MKILFIVLFIFFSNSHAKEITFLCKISEELENGKPASKKNYEQTPINLYLDKNEKWLNDFRKKDFLDNKKGLIDKISYNFIEQKKILFLDFLNTRQKKKKRLNPPLL